MARCRSGTDWNAGAKEGSFGSIAIDPWFRSPYRGGSLPPLVSGITLIAVCVWHVAMLRVLWPRRARLAGTCTDRAAGPGR
jgi:hypothetical protein